MTTFDDILKGLLDLNVEQLAEVRVRAGVLSQAGGSAQRTASADGKQSMPAELAETDVELVLSEIAGYLKDQGIEFASTVMLKRVQGFKAFEAKVPATMIFFRRVTTNRVKLRALIRVSIGLLYKDLNKLGLSVSTRTMMAHWHRVPAVIDSAFPGYARLGVLGLLLGEPLARGRQYVSDAPPKRKKE